MKIENHWLDRARKIPSPNHDNRPDEMDISLLVIHCISLPPGRYGGNYIDALFTNRLNPRDHETFKTLHRLRVSAHILIARDGVISQYVPFNKRAWHAGKSCYQGRERCNDFSIGIELEGTETQTYTEVQYTQLAQLIDRLIITYPLLSTQHIAAHSDIAPDRKNDPGEFFAWRKLTNLLDSECLRKDELQRDLI